MRYLACLPLPLALVAVPLHAAEAVRDEEAPAADTAETDNTEQQGNEILVVAERIRGQVEAPQPPLAVLDEKDIQALGATTLADVLTQLAPQTGSGRGRGGGPPVVLINGQRIGSFREMRNFPQEAIRRVEILPEEVALRFGFPPNSRVVNMILKDNFSSKTIEAETAFATRGGFQTYELEATALRINGPQRLSVTGRIDDSSELTEAERGVLPVNSLPGATSQAEFRSLIPDSRDLALNMSWARGLGKDGLGGSLSFNGNVTRSDSFRQSGLNPSDLTDVLQRRTRTTAVQGGAALTTRLDDWQLNATLDAAHSESRTSIDRPLTTIVDTARSNTESVTGLVTVVGRPLRIPGGEVTSTFRLGYAWADIVSDDTRSAIGAINLRRGDISLGTNIGLPITSRRENFGAGLGDLSLNFSAGYNELSDFGALTDWSAGLTWSPFTLEKLSLSASYLVNDVAPGLTQLGNPVTTTFNVTVFDFARGETVLASVISGGNASLRKERQRDLKFGATWQLPFLQNSSLVAEYFRNRSDDVTASFPLLTPEIESAFPGRVTRDATGRLTLIDQRPVTFAEQKSERLRWGLNLSGQLGSAPAGGGGMMGMFGAGPPQRGQGAGAPPPTPRPQGQPSGRPAGAGSGRGGGGMMGMFGGGGAGRWSLGVFHSVQFDNIVLIAPGGPVLDLLDGDSLSSAGSPRHSIQFNGGAFKSGFGAFFNGTWTGPSRLSGNGLPGASDLRFGSVTRFDINFFAALGQQAKLVKKAPFFKGTQIALRFENLFDSRQRVTDAAGKVPLGYQPDLIDPRGRMVEIEFRKMF
jgi:hypothetical protein